MRLIGLILFDFIADGSVRIFRDYESPRPFLVTGWKALSQMIPSTNHEAGLICEWQQGKGRLLAGGNAKEIKSWDAPTEVCQRVRVIE
jgi:regulator-associated protein of mTOR